MNKAAILIWVTGSVISPMLFLTGNNCHYRRVMLNWKATLFDNEKYLFHNNAVGSVHIGNTCTIHRFDPPIKNIPGRSDGFYGRSAGKCVPVVNQWQAEEGQREGRFHRRVQ